ncbi:MAG: hypothetical protein AAF351_14635 [Pseudomonadota bacterium]
MNRRVVGFAGGLVAVAIVFFIFWSNRSIDTNEPHEAEPPAVMSADEPASNSSGSRIPRDVFPDLNANENTEEGREYPADECARLENAFDDNASYIEDRVDEVREYGIEIFTNAAGAEYLWAGAILSWDSNEEAAYAFVKRSLEEYPEFYPMAALAVRECGLYGVFCEYFTDEGLLGRAEVSDDAATWAHLAKYYASNGEVERALDAVRRAAAAPKLSDQTLPTIRAAQQGLAIVSGLDEWERTVAAFGLGIEMAEPIYLSPCFLYSEESEDWLQACIGLGERLAYDGSAGLNRLGGLAMLGPLYDHAGRKEGGVRAAAEMKRIGDGLERTESWANRIALARDEQLLNEYLERWNDADDSLGLKYLQSEVERKIETGEYPALSDCVE